MRFPYRRYAVDPTPALQTEELFRPVIPVQMRGSKGSLDLYALVDTGSDETYTTQEMAETLGAEPLSDDLFSIDSASGSMEVVYGEVAIHIEQGEERHNWRAIAGIAPEIWSEAILGHAGFLHFFDADFSDEARVLELHRNKTPLR